ncbi:1902_t:CDS:2, partial [Gigaspora rosea]
KNPEHMTQLCELSSRSDDENFFDLEVCEAGHFVSEISIPIISQSKKDLLEGSFSEKVLLEKLSETILEESTEASISSNLTHGHAYFHNKILWGYKEFSSEKFDYYGIHEGSLCRVCKQRHEEGKSIKGRYEAGSYFIKCAPLVLAPLITIYFGICTVSAPYFGEMILHALTPEYLNWHAKLVDSPSHLTDKIRSSLYRAYMEETGLDLWIKSENLESSQIEEGNYTPQNCVIKISKFPEEKNPEAKCPICKEVHTHRGIWGDWSCLDKNDHYFLNCSFQAGLRQYAIEHRMDPEKFSVITEAKKNR